MVFIRVKNQIADSDLGLLERHLTMLDKEISEIHTSVRASRDPESDGLYDTGEYFFGQGFVAMQRYQSSVFGQFWIREGFDFDPKPKREAFLDEPPYWSGDKAVARVIHAAANYWKHTDEWWRTTWDREGGLETEPKKKESDYTLDRLETVAPWGPYYCSNILAALTKTREPMLSELVPQIVDWRDGLIRLHDRHEDSCPI
ncbi:hypothetical protein [Pseudophaeobacter sp.]|uniref:hypothetical protein n=1 Tax=Pseudophaeobacter sp. TaxID=1971739 RepID=UPI0032975BE0